MPTTHSSRFRGATCVCLILLSVVVVAGTFRWNWRKAEELDLKQNLSKLNLDPAGRTALQDAIAARLRPGMADLEIRSEKELGKVALQTRIKLVDLNADGVPEVVAQGCCLKAGCGATGNCPFWVFKKGGGRYKLLLEVTGQVFTIESRKTNGYADIVVGEHSSATEKILWVFRYTKGKYKDAGCYEADWSSWEGGNLHELKEPQFTPAPNNRMSMMDEQEFRRRADAALAALKAALITAEETAEMEVEDQAGALHISFDEPPGRFVISPNAPVRQIWISALSTSFKLDWSAAAQDFVLEKTGEGLKPLVARLINQQLGEEAVTLD